MGVDVCTIFLVFLTVGGGEGDVDSSIKFSLLMTKVQLFTFTGVVNVSISLFPFGLYILLSMLYSSSCGGIIFSNDGVNDTDFLEVDGGIDLFVNLKGVCWL